MFEDNSDLLDMYETTEQKMLEDNEEENVINRNYKSNNSSGQHLEFMGTPVGIGRCVIGLVILIIGIVISVAIGGEQETALECFGALGVLVAALFGAITTWRSS